MFNIIINLKEWSNISSFPNNVEFIFIIGEYNEHFDKTFGKSFIWF